MFLQGFRQQHIYAYLPCLSSFNTLCKCVSPFNKSVNAQKRHTRQQMLRKRHGRSSPKIAWCLIHLRY